MKWRREEGEVCGTCDWCKFDPEGGDYVCKNYHSDYYTDYVPYEHGCEHWEEIKDETHHG